nr:MAG TPA: hypothetical protein [Caudoviricetes sp.]
MQCCSLQSPFRLIQTYYSQYVINCQSHLV